MSTPTEDLVHDLIVSLKSTEEKLQADLLLATKQDLQEMVQRLVNEIRAITVPDLTGLNALLVRGTAIARKFQELDAQTPSQKTD